MNSCLYEGRVFHRRHLPVAHRFEFPLFMAYLDLAELPGLFDGRWLWSSRRPTLAWFRRADHFGDSSRPLDTCVRELVKDRTGRWLEGPIGLLTHLRYAGLAFNPVSFYYVHGAQGELEVVVAEVNNTPWGERYYYVLEHDRRRPSSDGIRTVGQKDFHVSPFMGMQQAYEWQVVQPARSVALHVSSRESSVKVFEAGFALERRELDTASLARALARYPFMTAQVFAGIYWQAFRLWSKGTPFYAHPGGGAGQMEMSR